jgi:hypothetical protein
MLVKIGEQPGKVDYLLKSGLDNITFDMKNLDKLAYLYSELGTY